MEFILSLFTLIGLDGKSVSLGAAIPLFIQYGYKFYADYTARKAADAAQKKEIDEQFFKHVAELQAEIAKLKAAKTTEETK